MLSNLIKKSHQLTKHAIFVTKVCIWLKNNQGNPSPTPQHIFADCKIAQTDNTILIYFKKIILMYLHTHFSKIKTVHFRLNCLPLRISRTNLYIFCPRGLRDVSLGPKWFLILTWNVEEATLKLIKN